MDIIQAFEDGFREGWIAAKKEYSKPPNKEITVDAECYMCKVGERIFNYCSTCGRKHNYRTTEF